jgi:hypothetical protein
MAAVHAVATLGYYLFVCYVFMTLMYGTCFYWFQKSLYVEIFFCNSVTFTRDYVMSIFLLTLYC